MFVRISKHRHRDSKIKYLTIAHRTMSSEKSNKITNWNAFKAL